MKNILIASLLLISASAFGQQTATPKTSTVADLQAQLNSVRHQLIGIQNTLSEAEISGNQALIDKLSAVEKNLF